MAPHVFDIVKYTTTKIQIHVSYPFYCGKLAFVCIHSMLWAQVSSAANQCLITVGKGIKRFPFTPIFLAAPAALCLPLVSD